MSDYATRLKELRESADLGVRELARRAGCSAGFVSRVEAKKVRPAPISLLRWYRVIGFSDVVLQELTARVLADGHDLGDRWPCWLPAAEAVLEEVAS